MEELLTLSNNFGEPVELTIGGVPLAGVVEEIEDDRFLLAGAWYPIQEAVLHV